VTLPSVAGKTLGTLTLGYVALSFWTSGGSNWAARSSNLGLQTIGVDFWGIHIRKGTWTAADTALYQTRDPGVELAMCQRYFEYVQVTSAINGTYINSIGFAVTKRAVPNITLAGGALAGGTFQADTTRLVQVNNSTGASGASFFCEAEL
jgi:hypothetical protein